MHRSVVIVIVSVGIVFANAHQRTPPGINPNTYQKNLHHDGQPPPIQPQFHQEQLHHQPPQQPLQHQQQQEIHHQPPVQQQHEVHHQPPVQQQPEIHHQPPVQQQHYEQVHPKEAHHGHKQGPNPAVLHKDMSHEKE